MDEQKQNKFLKILLGILGALLGLFLVTRKRPSTEKAEAKKEVDTAIGNAKQSAQNLHEKTETLQNTVKEATNAASSGTTQDRLQKLADEGIITRKKA